MRNAILCFSLSMIIGNLCAAVGSAELAHECYEVNYTEDFERLMVCHNAEENNSDNDLDNELDPDKTQGYVETMQSFDKDANSRKQMRFWDKCGIIYSSLSPTSSIYWGVGKANVWFSEIALGHMLWLDVKFLHTVLFIDLNICMSIPGDNYVIQGERGYMFQDGLSAVSSNVSYTPYFKDVMVRYIVATLPDTVTVTKTNSDRYIDAAFGLFLGEVNIQTFDLLDNAETEAILIHRIMLNRLIGGIVFNVFVVNTHAHRKMICDYVSLNTAIGLSIFSGNRSDRLTYASLLGSVQDAQEAVLLDAVLDIKLGRTNGDQSSYGFSFRLSLDLIFNKFLQIYNSLPSKNWKSDICRNNVQIGMFIAC